MTWAKLDDRANEHEKQLAAGPRACWLWACGLMYCNRQSKKTGRIPKAVVHGGMLFPGTGKRDADALIKVGLWHEDGDAYEVHEFHGWNPELSAKRAEAGRVGGKASGEARREATDEATTKQVASPGESKTEAVGEADDQLAHSRARTHAQPRAGSTPPHPTPPQSPGARRRWRRMPTDWEPKPELGQLALELGVDLAIELPKLRDWEFKDPKSDADATARTWIRNAKPTLQPGGMGGATPPAGPRMQLPAGVKFGAEGIP